MHAQFPGGAALVAFVFLEDGEDEAFFKFTNSLGIEDVALVHLHDEGFELILHGLSLSLLKRQYENLRTLLLTEPVSYPGRVPGLPSLGHALDGACPVLDKTFRATGREPARSRRGPLPGNTEQTLNLLAIGRWA